VAEEAAELTPTPERPVPRWRRILVAVLVVLSCILAPVSIVAVWIHSTLLDTDQYVSTVGPLAENAAIQTAVADRVTQAVTQGTNVDQKVSDALPKRAAFLAPYLATGIDRFVNAAALKFAQSSAFDKLWETANRRAHTQLVAVLEGKGTDTVATKNGQVVVNLGPVVDRVNQQLQKRGIDVFSKASTAAADKKIVLIDSTSLRKAQGLVDLLDNLAVVLPVVTALLLAAAIALSPRRRRTLLRAALGIALAVGLLLTVFNIGRGVYLDALGANVHRDAAGAVYDQLLEFLRTALRTVFVLAAVVAIGAWLAGPGHFATRVREGVRGLVSGSDETGRTPSAIAVLAARYKSPLRVTVAGIGFVVLIALSHPGPVAVLVIAVLVVLALLLIEFFASRAPRSTEVDVSS
jgi:hypothetical protein